MTDQEKWGRLTPARQNNNDHDNGTLPYIEGFESLFDTIETMVAYEFELSPKEMNAASIVLGRVMNLLSDIHLDPDRKYTVAEIVRLQMAIEWALGGER